jgi:hypothetical protein
MFMEPRATDATPVNITGPFTKAVLVGTAAAILGFGIMPGPLVSWASSGSIPLVQPENLSTRVIITAED